mmetsp:Transcript_2208/g.3348  ORF Transcript_2208/g.3348 Transcript_2208/m.3348 type:complete len:217 (+) Transcript_2208:53-703(+)
MYKTFLLVSAVVSSIIAGVSLLPARKHHHHHQHHHTIVAFTEEEMQRHHKSMIRGRRRELAEDVAVPSNDCLTGMNTIRDSFNDESFLQYSEIECDHTTNICTFTDKNSNSAFETKCKDRKDALFSIVNITFADCPEGIATFSYHKFPICVADSCKAKEKEQQFKYKIDILKETLESYYGCSTITIHTNSAGSTFMKINNSRTLLTIVFAAFFLHV